MELIAVALMATVGLFIFGMNRVHKTIGAYFYTAARSDDESEQDANNTATRIDTHRASQLNKD